MKPSPLEVAARAGASREHSLRSRGDARRARWGVVHTPVPLARAALQRVDRCLREALGLSAGLADAGVGLLDVSVGTGVWLAAALDVAGERPGAPAAVCGYDRDAAVLQVAVEVLGAAAQQAGWPLTLRAHNTLAVREPWPRGVRVPVIIGNPPWASRSDSRSVQPTAGWLDDFRRGADGQPLGERRVGVLSDDYVRFFRWAAEQGRAAPASVVCLATNASFLDGPVHRGMRARLREWFDGIEVVDLGGNALLPRGEKRDENVFGVRTGAALTLLWRAPGARVALGRVRHRRLWGSAADKLARLGDTTRTLPLAAPDAPWRPASPRGGAERWPDEALPLDEAMPFHREGVQTNRDAFATDASRPGLLARMERFAAGQLSGPPPRAHFDPARARAAVTEALARDPAGESWMAPLWYRPFERRFFVTLPAVSHRPRPELLRAASPENACLLTARKDRGERTWTLFAACRGVADACFLSTRSSCRTRVFPVVRPDGSANLEASAVARWLAPTGVDPALCDAQALLELALAQLAAPGYRARFDGLLRQGYPRLLPPAGADAFEALRRVGRDLLSALTGTVDVVADEARPGRPDCAVGHFRAPADWVNLPSAASAGWAAYHTALSAAQALFEAGAVLPCVTPGRS